MTKELKSYEEMSDNQRDNYIKTLLKNQLAKQFNSFTSYEEIKAYKAIQWFLASYDETLDNCLSLERYTLKYVIGAPIVYSLAIDDYKSYRESFVLSKKAMIFLGQEDIDDRYVPIKIITSTSIELITKVTVDKALYEKVKAKKKLFNTYVEKEKHGKNFMITDVQFENNNNRVVTYIVVPSVYADLFELSKFKNHKITDDTSNIEYEILGDNARDIEEDIIKTQELVADIVERISTYLNYHKIALTITEHFKLNIKDKDDTNTIIFESLEQILKGIEKKLIKIMNTGSKEIRANREMFKTFEDAKITYRRFIATAYHKIKSEEKAFPFLRLCTDLELKDKYIECRLEANAETNVKLKHLKA